MVNITIKNHWTLDCQVQRHNLIRGEEIEFFIRGDDSGEENKLTCDKCQKYKPWKAVTVESTVWCSYCLPYHDVDVWITDVIVEKNNNDEEIKRALQKEFVKQNLTK